ncbi:RNA 2',3'-cyclic phosphodiesterase [Marinitenerispora sediminis]|uniref:RNA 2',3'-cyclic phosphodiesterase n=1 Tax=Marinitenerispora sediminis TaxID=1931232 RepID=A0A368T6A7_9ACTN|nr:RNA 2',3'-cyclic phosphodiesterase [Marinitenerispora sediminis]RCV54884.1 RNA 2',3'-cyclic phosphodiesterase [Marinitenerispora sediminis]RCV59253.1 RNA 2',3'-cyclic phosphodiesterase [Marinitenerispora sediminis]RCV60285.1 RNA 2',3'-cyclic phosphodiesterase [Marinitenerispora sediminis]
MRLFVALTPPATALDELHRAVAAARGHRAAPRGVRWTPREEWHLTLLFLGEVPDPEVPALRARLAREAAAHPAMELALRGAGTFPADSERARVLWAGVEGDTEALTHLAGALHSAAAAHGVPVEPRPYVPHVTLARTRGPHDLSGPRDVLADLAGSPWRAGEAELVRSRADGRPRYLTVARWPLT